MVWCRRHKRAPNVRHCSTRELFFKLLANIFGFFDLTARTQAAAPRQIRPVLSVCEVMQ
jgi:hypothetical protein